MTARPDRPALQAEILRQTALRGAGKSICPSEVARALMPEGWNALMTPIRQAAVALAAEGRVEILRKGKPVGPGEVRGVIRLRVPTPPGADPAPDRPAPDQPSPD